MSGTASPLPPDEGVRRALPALTGEQRARLAQRLAQRSTDRGDAGQALPLTRRALSLADPARRLVALVEALGHERLVLPARVEADRGTTVVLASHDPGARDVADAVITLDSGRVIRAGED